MKMHKKITAAAAAAAIFLNCCLFIPEAFAEDYSAGVVSKQDINTVYISTAEDFKKFAENCTLDSYSQGKTFILANDISFTDEEFISVPSFSGIFDGNGYKISGFSLTESGSAVGIFRYVEKSGRVKNLNAAGKVSPDGTAAKCGGIAGVNRGSIYNCSFSGVVDGKERCGGIAGVNEENAMIAACTVSGRIQSEHFTGGITGENNGFIMRCENTASVNTNAYDNSLDIENINIEDIYSTESAVNVTDAGGIAGYSTGTVQDCKNSGSIGYPHVGYNIGGICGRQNGYISGCSNYGVINGRKDIGGIVGQAEPHFSLFFSENTANRLRDRLDEMNTIIDETISHADIRSDILTDENDNLISQLENVRSRSDAFLDETDRVINANIDSVNELSSRVSDLIDMAEPAADSFSSASDAFSESVDKLWEANDLLNEAMENTDEALDIIFPGLEALSDSIKELNNATASFSESLKSLKNALGNPEETKAALADLQNDIYTMKQIAASISQTAKNLLDKLGDYNASPETQAAKDKIKNSLERLSDSSSQLSDSFGEAQSAISGIQSLIEMENHDVQSYLDYINVILDVFTNGALGDMFSAFSDLVSGVSELIDSIAANEFYAEINRCAAELRQNIPSVDNSGSIGTVPSVNIDSLYDVIDHLQSTSDSIGNAGESASELTDDIKDAWEYLDDASASAIAAAYSAEEAVQHCSDASSYLSDGMDCVHDIIDCFAGKPEITFTGADDPFIAARDALSDSLSDLTDILSSLNEKSGDTVDILVDDLKRINDKAAEVYDVILDMVDEINSKSTELSDYTEDISAEDTKGRADGKIASCGNYGSINGDIGVGGIAGSMGVENSFDPEDDIETIGERSSNFMYQSRTVVRECVNRGEITSKKDSAGGIAGEMDTGCIINCTGLGNVRSTNGSYAGGIAGKSSAAIYGSSAMCRLEAKNYAGGIAGSGHDISGCRSFVNIDAADEFSGAVAGSCDGVLEYNTFVENGTGAVDGISYSGKAYPISYEQMLKSDNIPEEFEKLTLTFIDEDNVIAEIKADYGSSLPESSLPELPEKEGYFARWQEHDYSDMHYSAVIGAEYLKYVTAISSAELRGNDLPVFIAEGRFTDRDTLSAEKIGDREWQIHIPDDSNTVHKIHYQPVGDPKKTQLSVNGNTVSTEIDGKYLVFSAESSSISLSESAKPVNIKTIAAAAGAAAIIAAVLAIVIRKKSKGTEK